MELYFTLIEMNISIVELYFTLIEMNFMGNNHSHILSNNLLGEVVNLFDKSQRKRFLWQFASSELLGKIWVEKAIGKRDFKGQFSKMEAPGYN